VRRRRRGGERLGLDCGGLTDDDWLFERHGRIRHSEIGLGSVMLTVHDQRPSGQNILKRQ
jgi:hypothetical protein